MGHAKAKETDNQLNIRSDFARVRASNLSKRTGMTITQVIEEALRAYQPATLATPRPGLIVEGGLLVLAKRGGTIAHAAVEAELEEIRDGARE
jgi:hypothetical protein